MDPLAFRLLNEFQRDFPLVSRPFEEIGSRVGTPEGRVIQVFGNLRDEGKISRIGAVFRPNTVGASALVALAVPPQSLARVAALVSARPEVNHNYEREHRYNLWFVVAAPDEVRVACAIDAIERDTALKALRLPLEEEFHIDLGFDLEDGSVPRGGAASPGRAALGEPETRLVVALADGLPLVEKPYAALAAAAGADERSVIQALRLWLRTGVIRRFGVVVRHRPLGYHANAMVVWDVPCDAVRGTARRLAALPQVTLCYRRARQLPDWPYNLFCMVHGRERGAVRRAIEEATRAAGLEGFAREILFSGACHVQRGARYAHG
jgi:DNA-binding Lrp family transcriptional regulator